MRRHTIIPFSTHVPDLRRAVALGAPDTFVCNIAALGGIAATLKFVAACEAMGKGYWCYSNDLGIMTAAYLHLTAATHWITEPSQSLFRWQIGTSSRTDRSARPTTPFAFPKAPASVSSSTPSR